MEPFDIQQQIGETTILFKKISPKSKFLIIVNKGPGAVEFPREKREWDLAEIYFMNRDIEDIKIGRKNTEADYIIFEFDRNMRKFAIIKKFLEAIDDWQSYNSILMLDDDITPYRCSFSDIFRQFEKTRLRVGQPALSRRSFFTYEITRQVKNSKWRRTNFAEVMCPIFRIDAAVEYLPIFNSTISGFGLDNYWSKREFEQFGGCAILDNSPVKHWRPVRGGIAYQGLSPERELVKFRQDYSLDICAPLTFEIIRERSALSRFINNRLHQISHLDIKKFF